MTDNVAVAAGYRHPIHLGSCRGSFPADRLHLFSPGGVTEVAPLPVLAAIEDVVRVRAPEARVAAGRAARAGPSWRWRCAWSRAADRPGRRWRRWCRGIACRGCSGSATRCRRRRCARYRVALLERGVLVRAHERARGDSVRDAVRARRARTCWCRSGRGWCPPCRPRCWPSGWARRGDHRRVSRPHGRAVPRAGGRPGRRSSCASSAR